MLSKINKLKIRNCINVYNKERRYKYFYRKLKFDQIQFYDFLFFESLICLCVIDYVVTVSQSLDLHLGLELIKLSFWWNIGHCNFWASLPKKIQEWKLSTWQSPILAFCDSDKWPRTDLDSFCSLLCTYIPEIGPQKKNLPNAKKNVIRFLYENNIKGKYWKNFIDLN